MEQDLFRSFEKFVKAHQMFNKGDTIVTGVSGGADSTCLLLLLLKLKEEIGFSVLAVHIHHGIRKEEADADEAFVKSLCKDLDVPFRAERINIPQICSLTKESEEEAGRRLRYEIFCRIACEENGKIAVAHHRDDNAETVLMNLVRGSGVRGLSGMKPVSEMNGCTLLRPMLLLSREEIENWLREQGVSYCNDATNNDAAYMRNAMRLNVIPQLKKINEKASLHICESAQLFSEVEAYLEKETEKALEKTASFSKGRAVIFLPELRQTDPVIAKRILRKAVSYAAGSSRDITAGHIKNLSALSEMQSGRRVSLPYGLTARRQYDEIIIEKKVSEKADGDTVLFRMKKEEAGENWKTAELEDGRKMRFRTLDVDEKNRNTLTEKNQYTKAFDYDKIKNDIIVGAKAPGDRIFLRNGRKTVKKFFSDEKIPADIRPGILLVKDEKDVLWITGYRISEKHKITETTTKSLLVQFMGGDHEH